MPRYAVSTVGLVYDLGDRIAPAGAWHVIAPDQKSAVAMFITRLNELNGDRVLTGRSWDQDDVIAYIQDFPDRLSIAEDNDDNIVIYTRLYSDEQGRLRERRED